jgi:hypothetical protein
MVLGQLPSGNCPLRQLSPWTTVPRQFPLGQLVVVVVAERDILGICVGCLASYERLCALTLGGQLRVGVSQYVLMHVQVNPYSSPIIEQ